jgi:excisionase family DNA binding protein
LPNKQQPPRRARRHREPNQFAVTTEDLIRRRKLWPVDEAAHLLGVTRPTLYRYEARGLIHFTRVEGRTFVTDTEIDRFVVAAEAASERPKDQPA